jgi:hypothetical protein
MANTRKDNMNKYEKEYKDSQENPDDKFEDACESDDGKYYASINYVKFKDGQEPQHMWFVDVELKNLSIIDEDFYGNHYDAVRVYKDYEKDIIEYNKQASEPTGN